jgi:hypothetical protein
MKISSKTVVFLVIPVLLMPIAIANAQQTTIGNAQDSIYNAYNNLVGAYNSGADVRGLIDQLNQAINLTSQAQALSSSDPQQALVLATQAQAIAQNVTVQASATKNTAIVLAPVTAVIIAAAFVAVGCLVYLFGPKLFWQTWLKLRKNYRVRAKNGASKFKGLAVSAEQVCAVILGITIIIALVATVPFLLPRNTGEQFSELGILGPNMQLGDYPSIVVAGQPVSLFVYVGNQMGQPIYYNVMVKLGNNNTATDPAPVTSISQYSSILPNNGTWTFPVSVTLPQPGLNQRIIFELWTYNQTLNQLQYQDRWGQVWLNVTAPAS